MRCRPKCLHIEIFLNSKQQVSYKVESKELLEEKPTNSSSHSQ